MTLRIHTSPQHLASALAEDIANAIALKPDLVLGLPAGRTPILLYREIVAASRARTLDWSRIRTFNLDELVATKERPRQTYRQFMHDHLLGLVNVAPAHVDCPDGRATDLNAECARYERAIASAGGLDLVLLGIGANGHIGFNEPGSDVASRTRVTTLTDESRAANAWLFDDQIDHVPTHAVTMGLTTILSARAVMLVATGAEKAAAVSAMMNGEITTALPASFLRRHADLALILDEAAAGASGGSGHRSGRTPLR